MLLLAAASACVFDGSALEERRCLYSEECGEGLACVGGFCQPAPIKGDGGGNNPANNNPTNNNPANNSARCPNGAPPNPCGGCEALLGLPGTACGSCNDGEWVCTEQGDATCQGGSAPRDYYLDGDGDTYGKPDDKQSFCEPRGAYSAQNADDCDDDNAQVSPTGEEVCDGLDNDCDGFQDEGVTNACGGCATLDAAPDTPCGAGGTWRCQGESSDVVACVGGNSNVCGGSAELQGAPGDTCGQCGVLRCKNPELLECDDPGRNACGGCNALTNTPGAACGACGERVCDGMTATRCDDPGQNDCGGCGVLNGAPGDRCGECGTLRCDSDDALTCDDPGANVCGGCGVISGTLAGTCGDCGLDRLECDGTDALRCSGNTPCPLAMVRVAAGTFTMGSPGGEPGRPGGNKERQHQVTLTRTFRAATTELTQGVWRAVTGELPPIPLYINGAIFCEDCPVYGVSWYDAVEFANAISQRDGLAACYTFSRDTSDNITRVEWDTACTGYRLPTEAEWEYMTRAGTTTAVYNGDIRIVDVSGCKVDQNGNVLDIAWTCEDNVQTPQRVRLPTANAWGLYDSSGNVAEWTWDKHINDHPSSAQTDPTEGTVNACPGTGSDCNRTVRGGAWRDGADKVRSAARVGMDGRTAQPTVGLRLVRTLFE